MNNPVRRIEQGPLRPPSESRSLFIRVARNCPWNHCAFCPAFKEERFSLRPLKDVLSDIRELSKIAENQIAQTVFLQDADSLITPNHRLVSILKLIKELFPAVERITAYSRSSTLWNKSTEELKALKDAGLNRIHVGFESGCTEVLDLMQKGVTAQKQKEGCLRAKEAGLDICCYYMPGLGGKTFSQKHALESAKMLKEISPAHVRLRTCFVLEDTPLAELYYKGIFQPLSEVEIIEEIKIFLETLQGIETELISDHRINLLLELRGKIPDDYTKLKKTVERFLTLSEDEKKLFIIGRRLNLIRHLDELLNPEKRKQIEDKAPLYRVQIPAPRNILY